MVRRFCLVFCLVFIFLPIGTLSALGETCFEEFRKPKGKYCNQHISYLINDVVYRTTKGAELVEMIAWKGGHQKGSVEALFCLSDLDNQISPQVVLVKLNPRCRHGGYYYNINYHKPLFKKHFWIECYRDTHRQARKLWEEGGKKGIPPRKRRDACRDLP
ncbi:MAG: hypothetical protein F4X55_02915 [Candidatus Dadabacteria bacterium]|nr:hypothetical protein [Candidatus Dadabacteria bacterium]